MPTTVTTEILFTTEILDKVSGRSVKCRAIEVGLYILWSDLLITVGRHPKRRSRFGIRQCSAVIRLDGHSPSIPGIFWSIDFEAQGLLA